MVFGALAVREAGLGVLGAAAMSLAVFAGSSQFVAVTMLAQGSGVLVIILTTLIVNLRHMLYSASLAPHMRSVPTRWLLPMAFWLTDETYSVTVDRWAAIPAAGTVHDAAAITPDGSAAPARDGSDREGVGATVRFHLGSALAMYTNWNLWTLVGAFAGSQIEGIAEWGLDFAMVVTFIGIVVPRITSRPALVSALSAAVVGVAANGLPHGLGLIVAAIVGIAAGYGAESWALRTSSARGGEAR